MGGYIGVNGASYAREYWGSTTGNIQTGTESLDKAISDLEIKNDPIVSHTKVRSGMEQSWIDSNPGTENAQEQGGWILGDMKTSEYEVSRWATGKQASLKVPPKPKNAIAHFHTHPNTGPQWNPNPSPPDIRATQSLGIPGYVINERGIVRIDPITGGWNYVHTR